MPYFHDIDPIALQIGPLAVHWYGIMYLLSFAIAWYVGNRRRAQGRLPVSYDAFSDLSFYVMLGVILGGRIWYMLSYVPLDWIVHDPLAIFRVWDGGMSFHGGLLGVLLAGWIWSRRQRIHFFDTIDFVAPLFPIGLGLGRLGNFSNGELWGKLTDAPWGVIFPSALDGLGKTHAELKQMYLAGQLNDQARHPSQLYEFALEGVVMFAVLYVYSMKPRPRYAVAGLFGILYGVFRFAIEFVRIPDAQLGYLAFGWVTMGQIQSLPLIVIGLVLCWMSHRAPTLQPDPAAAMSSPKPVGKTA